MLRMDENTLLVGNVVTDIDVIKLGPTRSLIQVRSGVSLKRGTYVTLGDDAGEYFIGEVVDGPYYLSSRASPLYVVQLSASVKNGIPAVVLTRPLPETVVKMMHPKDVQIFLGAVGGMSMGRLPTHDEKVEIGLDPATLTRHLGIFGTTGSGKSNTIQVVIEESTKNDFAVVVFDVEGEYIFMDKPTDRLIDLLKIFGGEPQGIDDLKVYIPALSSSRREDAEKFSISFIETDKDLFAEVSGLNRIEQLYFRDIIEKVEQIAPAFRKITLEAVIERLQKRLNAQADNPTMPEFIAEAHTSLYSKLHLIQGLGLVDTNFPTLKPKDLVVKERVSVVDFSDADDYVRNLVIANMLNSILAYKIANPDTPKILIVIEEAHTFISNYKRDKMLATLLMLIELARRGRKRGVCLGFVTQQPAHLPSEILELCNTRIMHRMSSKANIQILKESTGNVPEPIWEILPSLGRGETIMASPKYYRAVTTKIRPVKSMRIATE